jgi:uncharacterized protein
MPIWWQIPRRFPKPAMQPAQRADPELSSAPVNPSERIDAVDALRGLALFGVMAIHATMEFRVSIFEQFLPRAGTASRLDDAVQTFLTMAVELKAFALFSLLFGVGMAIQFERLAANPRRTVLLVRRLAVLLAIGLVHLYLIWNGDILTEYSLAGLLVLPFLWGPRWLLAAGAALFLALYLAMPLWPPLLPWPTTSWIREHLVTAQQVYGSGGFPEILAFRIQEVQVYGSGGFPEILAFRIREVAPILPLHVAIFPRTLALFLLGMLAWRMEIVRRPADHRHLLLAVAITGVAVGGALTVAEQMQALSGLRAHFSLERFGTVALATGYAAALFAILNTATGKWMLGWAAPMGRMAFTNYLGQSIIFSWIFYGYGLGLYGRVGVVTALAIGVAVYVAEVVFSAQWLRHYRFGPVEWLWRSLMYGSRQRLRRS